MNMIRYKIVFLLLLSILILGGCAFGPNYLRPQTAADTPEGYFRSGRHSEDVNELAGIDRWWEAFGDVTTSQLVRRALENNFDLKAAAGRVLQARASFAEIRGRRMPDISYNFLRDRSKRSFNFGVGGRISPLTTTYTQDISISYVLDLFGKLKRAEQAAWAELLAAEANEQALINSLIASVINLRVEIATLQKRLAISRDNTESRENTLKIVERRYSEGLVGPVDVRLARENLAYSKSLEPDIELSLAIAHNLLDVLVARRPGSSAELAETLPDLPQLEPIPIGLPASLLDRRPDVIASEMALRATNERIGVSIAQLYPDLTLSGAVGRSADKFRDIFIDETEIYSAIFRLVQPVYRGGQLRAQVKGAKARYLEAAANYANTVLGALKEVEDELIREQMQQKQLGYVQLRLNEALAAESLSRERYQRGLENLLTVLESERRRRAAEDQLAILKGQIWTARVNLFLALGGDWTYEEPGKDERGR